ncbi:hypothetical protein C8R47DRAFT_1087845 [Mycena vitilis]|nr:hypothetical protein C8R47DRAFT_1087845 [Mycena vitilis]
MEDYGTTWGVALDPRLPSCIGVVLVVEFRLSIPASASPNGYLFLCPAKELQTGSVAFKWPDCPAYWGLRPGGKRLSIITASRFGFPAIQLSTEILGRFWEGTEVYAGLRQFYDGKNFDPDSQDIAVYLKYPLYQLVRNINAPPNNTSASNLYEITSVFDEITPEFSDSEVRLGDIDLLNEICFDNTDSSGTIRSRRNQVGVRRLYNGKMLARRITVAMYDAHVEWIQDVATYASLSHPNIIRMYGSASKESLRATVFYDGAIFTY